MMRKMHFKSIAFKLILVSFWVFNVVAENYIYLVLCV